MKCCLMLLMMSLISGCVYPVHKTLQPESKVTVLDSKGAPVHSAEVYLIANSYPYSREKSRNMKKTNATGVVGFPLLQEWRVEMFMIHGSEEFYWNWCVKKDGYVTQSTRYYDGGAFDNHITMMLEDGVSEGCPKEFR